MEQNIHEKTMRQADLLKEVLLILRETFEGSPPGEPSAYLDRGTGVFSTLDALSAEQVSRYTNGSTVAAHTEHAKFYLDRICEFMNGRTEKVNWEQSWLIETVNEIEWDFLREGVRKSYEGAVRCFVEIETWNDDNIGEAIAIIAHTAYHLGAMRHIMKSVKHDENN